VALQHPHLVQLEAEESAEMAVVAALERAQQHSAAAVAVQA